jgi:membrane protease YdiL (CAAX protease family)
MVKPPTAPRTNITRIFISPDEPRLRAGWRLSVHFLLLICSLLAFGIIGVPFILLFEGQEYTFRLVNQGIAIGGITLSVYLARRFVDRRSLRGLGLSLNPQAWRDLLVGFFIAGLMLGFIFGLEWAFGWLSYEGFTWEILSPRRVITETVTMFAIYLAVGWSEELLSRGYWLQNIEEGLDLDWALFISSTFFALAHIGNPGFSWIAMLGLLVAGYFLAFGYVRTRQLWLPIGLHIGWNFFEGTVFGFPVSGTDSFRLIIHTVKGPTIWTGGAFGPEAGLILLPGLVFGGVLIFWYTQRRRQPKTNP